MLKIGVSGNRGSFSEEAANYYCHKNKISDYEIVYLISVERVLKAYCNNEINKGFFPIENSNGGIVYEAVYAMSKYNFNIENIFEIDVRHCLLVKPGTNPGSINKVVSHQQGLRQCRMYLKRKWPEVDLEEYSDTAQAASDLRDGILNAQSAVIASRACAELYGLEILEEGIQDLKFNFTSFIATDTK
jgi:prephenate dehydratase